MADGDTPLSASDVAGLVKGCTACQLHRVGNGPIPFRGSADSGVCVVGEAPGKVEDEERSPFVGPSGEKLMSWLNAAGFAPSTIAYCNTVSCFPKRTPTGQEITACRGNLHMQLASMKPSLLLLFGGVAISSWWSNMRVGEIRGHYWQASVSGLEYKPVAMATWHPAAVLRNHTLEQEAIMDLMLAKAFLDGNYNPDDDKGCVKCSTREGTLVHISHDERVVSGAEYGVPFCEKHWAFRTGTGGQGRVTKKAPAAKRGKQAKTEKMF